MGFLDKFKHKKDDDDFMNMPSRGMQRGSIGPAGSNESGFRSGASGMNSLPSTPAPTGSNQGMNQNVANKIDILTNKVDAIKSEVNMLTQKINEVVSNLNNQKQQQTSQQQNTRQTQQSSDQNLSAYGGFDNSQTSQNQNNQNQQNWKSPW